MGRSAKVQEWKVDCSFTVCGTWVPMEGSWQGRSLWSYVLRQHVENVGCALGQGARVHGGDWWCHMCILPCGRRWRGLRWSTGWVEGNPWIWVGLEVGTSTLWKASSTSEIWRQGCACHVREAPNCEVQGGSPPVLSSHEGSSHRGPRRRFLCRGTRQCSVGGHDWIEEPSDNQPGRAFQTGRQFCPSEKKASSHHKWWTLDCSWGCPPEKALGAYGVALVIHWSWHSSDQRFEQYPRSRTIEPGGWDLVQVHHWDPDVSGQRSARRPIHGEWASLCNG